MVDADDDRPGLMPTIDGEIGVTRRFHDPAHVVGADDQDRDRTQPAFDFLADQVEGREDLRRRRGDAQFRKLIAEQGGPMARTIRCENDAEPLPAEAR